jgi:hypothetical protein
MKQDRKKYQSERENSFLLMSTGALLSFFIVLNGVQSGFSLCAMYFVAPLMLAYGAYLYLTSRKKALSYASDKWHESTQWHAPENLTKMKS